MQRAFLQIKLTAQFEGTMDMQALALKIQGD